MFIQHYDKDFINCRNSQFDILVYNCKILFGIYNKNILESDIINAFYENDDIYYSGKFLFKSDRALDELYGNYCCLAKLIYKFYNRNIYNTELDTIVSCMCSGERIPLELIDNYIA